MPKSIVRATDYDRVTLHVLDADVPLSATRATVHTMQLPRGGTYNWELVDIVENIAAVTYNSQFELRHNGTAASIAHATSYRPGTTVGILAPGSVSGGSRSLGWNWAQQLSASLRARVAIVGQVTVPDGGPMTVQVYIPDTGAVCKAGSILRATYLPSA